MRITAAQFIDLDPRTDLRQPRRRLGQAELNHVNSQLHAGNVEILDQISGWWPYTHTIRTTTDREYIPAVLHAQMID